MVVPLQWLSAALIAATVHEGCHIISIIMVGGTIRKVKIGLGGTQIEAEISGTYQELICALAGPLGSLFLLVFLHRMPQVALCGLVQGLFNLLPIYPLDGGRILYCSLSLLIPAYADIVTNQICQYTLITLAVLSIFAFVYLKSGLIPILITLHLMISRKKTCKRFRIGIQ